MHFRKYFKWKGYLRASKVKKKKQDANIGIFAASCGLIYFHCTLRISLKLPSCVTGYSRSYEKFHSDPGPDLYLRAIFISCHITRAYQKLFSDDPARLQFITSLKNVQGSITLKTYRQGYYIFFLQARQNTICQCKRNFSAVYCTVLHHLYCRAVLRSYSFLFIASKGIFSF